MGQMRISPSIWRTVALAVAAFALASAFYFERFLIEQKDLEEVQIRTQHRPTPTIVTIMLRQCNRKFKRNQVAHTRCVNDVLGI